LIRELHYNWHIVNPSAKILALAAYRWDGDDKIVMISPCKKTIDKLLGDCYLKKIWEDGSDD